MKKISLLLCIVVMHLTSFAQCDLPSSEVTNTGSNMTVMFTSDFISSLPITHFSSKFELPLQQPDYLQATRLAYVQPNKMKSA